MHRRLRLKLYGSAGIVATHRFRVERRLRTRDFGAVTLDFRLERVLGVAVFELRRPLDVRGFGDVLSEHDGFGPRLEIEIDVAVVVVDAKTVFVRIELGDDSGEEGVVSVPKDDEALADGVLFTQREHGTDVPRARELDDFDLWTQRFRFLTLRGIAVRRAASAARLHFT